MPQFHQCDRRSYRVHSFRQLPILNLDENALFQQGERCHAERFLMPKKAELKTLKNVSWRIRV